MKTIVTSPRDRRSVTRLTRETLAVVLAGGRGSRLEYLTKARSKPAVPFGGKFRIIDFTLSNCINSGIRRISILTQYKAHSLIQHIERGWAFCRPEFGEFIELLPAQQRLETSSWYLGTADAVYQNFDIIRSHDPTLILILAGDHIYKMDYGTMIAQHVEQGAELTIGCVEVPLGQAGAFGLVSVDPDGRIVGFKEKPQHPEPMAGRTDAALVSMGIYLMSSSFLYEHIERDAIANESSHDFGKDIIPKLIEKFRLVAFPFTDAVTGGQAYWRDVGTVDAYWEANIELTHVTPELNLYDEDWPILTYQEQLPPAKFVFDEDNRRGIAVDSLVSVGCVISGATVRRSLLSNHVRVNSYAVVEDSVVLPDVEIGRHSRIRRTIIDNGCSIPEHMVIGEDPEADRKRFYVSPSGVVVVCPHMLGQSLGYIP